MSESQRRDTRRRPGDSVVYVVDAQWDLENELGFGKVQEKGPERRADGRAPDVLVVVGGSYGKCRLGLPRDQTSKVAVRLVSLTRPSAADDGLDLVAHVTKIHVLTYAEVPPERMIGKPPVLDTMALIRLLENVLGLPLISGQARD